MSQKITTFLMFEGRAEEAMNFYISLFPGAKMVDIQRYGPEGPGPEGRFSARRWRSPASNSCVSTAT